VKVKPLVAYEREREGEGERVKAAMFRDRAGSGIGSCRNVLVGKVNFF
jgi:hypothetical protein